MFLPTAADTGVDARAQRFTVDDDRASATLPEATAVLRGVELEVIAQHVQQRGVGRSGRCPALAVDAEGDGHGVDPPER
jgi:hypothetical protein